MTEKSAPVGILRRQKIKLVKDEEFMAFQSFSPLLKLLFSQSLLAKGLRIERGRKKAKRRLSLSDVYCIVSCGYGCEVRRQRSSRRRSPFPDMYFLFTTACCWLSASSYSILMITKTSQSIFYPKSLLGTSLNFSSEIKLPSCKAKSV